ncbi:MAG: prepilin-type N-terminal cleavage/methylation domain-containing protein [Planctomycetes bacterium]|nr:prepilin-type N-terminal cleavage/methylation domain-containing protein [Planctomycetota bacterium]
MGKSGFTIFEVLLVAMIIAIITAIAVPMLVRSKIPANEVSAQQTLKAISAAQILYRRYNPEYGTVEQLLDDQYLFEENLRTTGLKSGYLFQVTVDGTNTWYAEARPESYQKTGVMTFYIDETLILRACDLLTSEYRDRVEAYQWDAAD